MTMEKAMDLLAWSSKGPREIALEIWNDDLQCDEDETRIQIAAEIIRRATQVAPWMDPILHAHWNEVEGLDGREARALMRGEWAPLMKSEWPFTRQLGAALERASWDV